MSEPEVPAFVTGRVGKIVRKYRIERVLGVGGMAAVYAATHRNGNRVALKMLHPAFAVDPEFRARFLREGYVANRVDHPGVVRVIDDDECDDGSVFLVMELLVGQSAEHYLRDKGQGLPVREVLPIAYQLLDVLAAAHDKGIVHRDVKPENLFLTRGGVKVLDFGIARLIEPGGDRTRTGRRMGTPAFMAPEQALGRVNEIGPWTDVWAVGATVFSLLTSRYVHQGETPEELMIASATRPAPGLATVLDDVDPAVAAIVDRALQLKREERWASAADMRQAVADTYDVLFGGVGDLAPHAGRDAVSPRASLPSAPGGAAPEPPPPAPPAAAVAPPVAIAATDFAAPTARPPAQPTVTVTVEPFAPPLRPPPPRTVHAPPAPPYVAPAPPPLASPVSLPVSRASTTAGVGVGRASSAEGPTAKRWLVIAIATLAVLVSSLVVVAAFGLRRLTRGPAAAPSETGALTAATARSSGDDRAPAPPSVAVDPTVSPSASAAPSSPSAAPSSSPRPQPLPPPHVAPPSPQPKPLDPLDPRAP